MKEEVLVPSVGESVIQGTLTAWIKGEGESVEEGEDLFELETDKATVSVPSPASGILHILVQAGQDVEIGQVVGSLETSPASAGAAAEALPGATKTAPRGAAVNVSPLARKVLEDHGLDAQAIRGTGPGGRITKEDALRAVEQRAPLGAAAPATREGTPAAREVPKVAAPATEPSRPAAVGRQTREPMSRLRKTLSARLVQARQQTALLTTFNEVNMEQVLEFRKRYGEAFEKAHGVRLGLMSFFVKACCRALQDFPVVNARIEGDEIVYNHFYDIGVAVSTERGLVVPVLRDADSLSFWQVEKRILELAERARERKITPDELAGGTFTITNGGVFGSLLSTPLPNYPQPAILGMHAIQRRPVAAADQVVIKPMMYLALSYDHRLVDGREAVLFLAAVKGLVEEPQRLLLEL